VSARAVRTSASAFRAAVAELVPRVRLGDAPGCVAIVDGDAGWVYRLADVAGAAGAVVVEPDPASAEAHALVASLPFPVVVLRHRLRPDVVADAVGPVPRHVTVDAWGGRADAARLLRDAVGWARVLAGGPLAPLARADTPAATTLALDGPAAASVTCSGAGGVGGALVATALDARRMQVRVDSATRLAEVAFEDDTGRRVRPPRRESAERLALRRILDAIEAGERPDDLLHLAADDRLVSP